MSEHTATIRWESAASAEDFLKGRYAREHTWTFDGGLSVPATASPSVVRSANPAFVDPEEALVASLSSCHMLTFVHMASRKGFVVQTYEDQAVGTMSKNDRGVPWVSAVVLRPRITWAGERRPTAEELDQLHHAAHEQCFISQSVKTSVTVESAG
jgi:organic hydroperoxide reductase OsmC/OhrA